MKSDLTIIILVHNNQKYLQRILDYYTDCPYQLCIADSSINPAIGLPQKDTITYVHTNASSLFHKLAFVLENNVHTKYVCMCGVDDFTVISGLDKCVDFLNAHPDYSSAIGNCFYFEKLKEGQDTTYFTIYDPPHSFTIDSENVFERLSAFFDPYRTTYTGIHYAVNLKDAFVLTQGKISNLFLNEYLPGIYSIIKGKHIEIGELYQVRENEASSDGTRTPNLNRLAFDPALQDEYHRYIDLLAAVIAANANVELPYCKEKLNAILTRYALFLKEVHYNTAKPVSGVKKTGNLISMVPLIGKKIVLHRRDLARNRKLKMVIKNEADRDILKTIDQYIKKYARDVS